jgi:hypothetical protein
MFVFCLIPALTVWADDEKSGPGPGGRRADASPFWRDAAFKASWHYFQRYRDRYDLNTDHFETNLSHASSLLALDFESGFLAGRLGLDFGVFGGYDFYNEGDPHHEMNFFPDRDPWQPDWSKKKAKNAASVYKAAVKFKAGPLWARAGYFQPSGPGVMGVNWSFLPGSYQGAEAGLNLGRLALALTWANQYKAPWFNEVYKFKKNDGQTDVSQLWSFGARYELNEALSLEAAYGESEHYLWNAHFKAKYALPQGGDRLYLTWQTYLMDDLDNPAGTGNDNFSSTALQQYLAARYDRGPWSFNLDFTYTRAPNKNPENAGYFAYRLISRYGGANGAYEPWWDLRSDWNHHEEKAVFIKIGRSLDDLGLTGVRAAVSGAHGWGGQARDYPARLKETAFGLDLSYAVPEGFLKGAVFALHFTNYDNRTGLPSWNGFLNAFQDEHDLKFSMTIPLTK